MYELILDSTQEVIFTGSQYDCLGKFQSLCGFSYENHKLYTLITYTIEKKEVIFSNKSILDQSIGTMTFACSLRTFNEAYEKWMEGMNIQEAFPFLNAEEREFILTGILPDSWNNLFPKEEDE